jgi:4a-hydroxytetrahydrobiopterin dehydratase
VALLDDDAVRAGLTGLGWERQGDELVKVHKGKGFVGALVFVNAVGYLAEAANHHPDVDIRWDTVTLHLSTHSEGGITQGDLEMAKRIDALPGA